MEALADEALNRCIEGKYQYNSAKLIEQSPANQIAYATSLV
jgi:hypothetical protein